MMASEAVSQNYKICWFTEPISRKLELDPCIESEVFSKSLPVGASTSDTSFLGGRLKQIPKELFALIKDEKWMAMVGEFFAAASNLCSLIGTEALRFVPFLSILSAPVYLFHAIKEAKHNLKCVVIAYKMSRVSDAFFHGGEAMGAVGNALSDMIKPFAGGLVLLGLSQIPGIAFTFSTLFPIILIVLSLIGGATQGWVLGRSSKALSDFKKKRKLLDGSLHGLEKFLEVIQGPTPTSPAYVLNAKNWSENHFTARDRQLMIQKRIRNLLGFDGGRISNAALEASQKIFPLIAELQRAIEAPSPPLQRIEKILEVSEQLLASAKLLPDTFFLKEIKELKSAKSELEELKKTLYLDGIHLADTFQNEIERKVAERSFSILAAALTLVAAFIFLYWPQQQTLAYILSVTSSTLSLTGILLNKSISYKHFQHTKKFSKHLLETNLA